MARSADAIVTPSVLVWARESSALDLYEAAERLGVSATKLALWEDGAEYPSVVQLGTMARIYSRPVAAFYLPEPPSEPALPHDFRAVGASAGDTPALRAALRRAQSRREIALDLLASMGQQPPNFGLSCTIGSDVDVVAAEVRNLLGITVGSQTSWVDLYQALRAWRSALEAQGILVFQVSGVDVSTMRGFSFTTRPFPVIAVNIKDSVRARMFSLFHEIGHILLGDGGLCDFEDRSNSPDHAVKETFCNRLAGAILVPLGAPEGLDLWKGRPDPRHFTLSHVAEFSRRFWVSDEVMLIRLGEIGAIPPDLVRGMQHLIRMRQLPAPQSSQVPVFRKIIARSGPAFVRLVLDAYHQEAITLSEVADYLDVKVQHIPKIEDAVYRSELDVDGDEP